MPLSKYMVSSKHDEDLLTMAVKGAVESLRNKYLLSLPEGAYINLGTRLISFEAIREKSILNGYLDFGYKYYRQDCHIEADAPIVYLEMPIVKNTIEVPLFIGEIKKQGTNDIRMNDGFKKQAIGNACGDRVAKNFIIASDFCSLCSKELFPYTVFLHGCDFGDEITKTTLSKVEPLFGLLNQINPFFDTKACGNLKGGSCFYQEEDFTYNQLQDIIYKICEIGIKHYEKAWRTENF